MKHFETEQVLSQRAVFAAISESVCTLCALSTVPTHDWTTQAAAGVVRLSRNGCAFVGFVHEQHEQYEQRAQVPSSLKFCVESAGLASVGEGLGGLAECDQVKAMMHTRIERVREYGFPMTEAMCRLGVVGRLDVLNRSWRETGFGRIWAGTQVREALIAVIPVAQSVTGRISLICMLGEFEAGGVSVDAFDAVISRLCMRAQGMLSRMEMAKSGGFRWLTVREQEVLDALVQGHSVREIAAQFGRSQHTVHDHVKSLHKKLDASSRGELVAMALGHCQGCGDSTPTPVIVGSDGVGVITEIKPSSSTVTDSAIK